MSGARSDARPATSLRSAVLPRAVLHVAALPFPSHQGTQAAIAAMLDALAQSGSIPELLTYAHGEGASGGFVHHRAPSLVPDRSLRSGPSMEKVLNDVGLAFAVRHHAARASAVVAHHVEAAAAARMAGKPVLFIAHTALGPELPTYLPSRWSRPMSAVGSAIDRFSLAGASAVAAISPLLAANLASLGHRVVHVLPIPWSVPSPIAPSERAAARAQLGLEAGARVVLYAGNLDAYQGLEVLLAALDRLHVTLLLATEDRLERLPSLRSRRGPSVFSRLATESDRRRVHAAADVVALPRRSPGGLPVKLLDALARGVPVVAVPRALAGHEGTPVVVARNDDAPEAFGEAIAGLLALDEGQRSELGERGRSHVARHHSGPAFVAAYHAALADALTR